MEKADLKLITKMIHQYRNEVSCQTSGEHRGASKSASLRTVKQDDVHAILSDIKQFCDNQGWDFKALLPK